MGLSIGLWWARMQRAHLIKLRSLLLELVCVLWKSVCFTETLIQGSINWKISKKCFNFSHSLSLILYILCSEWCNHCDHVILLLLRIFVVMNETLSFGLSEFCFYWNSSEAAGWWVQLKWSWSVLSQLMLKQKPRETLHF